MEEKRPDEVPEASGLRWVLKRWAELSAQLRCPACGTGRLPETRFCAKCGAELPPIRHEESPEALKRQRAFWRAVNWLVDLVPSIVYPKVIAASLAAMVLGVVGVFLGFVVMSGAMSGGQFGAFFTFFRFLSVAGAGALTYLIGLGWLLSGRLWPFWEAYAEFRLKHVLLAVVLAMLGFCIALWLL